MQMASSLRLATIDPASFDKVNPSELAKRIESYANSARGLANLFPQPTDDLQIGVGEALLFSNNDKLSRELLGDGNDRLLTKARSLHNPDKAVDLIVRIGPMPAGDRR